jgi:diaminopimelate decarboxylase
LNLLDPDLLHTIAKDIGTPCYVYDGAMLVHQYQTFVQSFQTRVPLIAAAVKANPNPALLKLLAQQGAGADIVSFGELQMALRAGIPVERIVFSGVGKSRDELSAAIEHGVYQINIESEEELNLLGILTREQQRVTNIAIRINPNVEAETHAKITTGTYNNKFGVDLGRAMKLYAGAVSEPYIKPIAVAMHIGSQLTQMQPFIRALDTLKQFVKELGGQGITLERLDLGGGLGVTYTEEHPPSIQDYAQTIEQELQGYPQQLVLEPGRALFAEMGVLLTTVIRPKKTANRHFLVIDAAMNDLMRPALYDARHPITPILNHDAPSIQMDVVGAVCESSDNFGIHTLPVTLSERDILCIGVAGAYGASMSNTYNCRPLVPEVLVENNGYRIIRRRPTVEEMMSLYVD